MQKLLLVVSLASFTPGAYAKTLPQSFVELSLPANWVCLDGVAGEKAVKFVCHCPVGEKGKEAKVEVTASVFEGKPEAELAAVRADYAKGKAVPIPASARPGSGEWVSSPVMEAGPDAYVHYLATTMRNLKVEVAFVAQKNEFSAYLPIFDPAAHSVRLMNGAAEHCGKNYRSAADILEPAACKP